MTLSFNIQKNKTKDCAVNEEEEAKHQKKKKRRNNTLK